MGTDAAIWAFIQGEHVKGRIKTSEFAKRLGVGSQMATEIVKGRKRWDLNHLDATAAFFDCSPCELIERAQAFVTNPKLRKHKSAGGRATSVANDASPHINSAMGESVRKVGPPPGPAAKFRRTGTARE
jgi:hypothetical protein